MDNKKIEQIVHLYTPKLYNYILKFVHQREDAEDILQNSFLAFYKKMDKVEEKKYSSYLYRICHNKALNFLDKHKETAVDPADFTNIVRDDSFNDENKRKELMSQIISYALSQLNPKMTMLIDMKFYRKMSYKDIIQETGFSQKAIESQLVRAKKKLRIIIEDKAKIELGVVLR